MDWKRYDDNALKKRINEGNEELIKRWETAEKEVERLTYTNKSLYKEIRDKDEQIKLLIENLDETQKKLFTTEKELEVVTKSIKPLDEDECAMMEVYTAKEEAIKEEQIKRVDGVLKNYGDIVEGLKNEINEVGWWRPENICECEICSDNYDINEVRGNFSDKFATPRDYYLNRCDDVCGGMDMLYYNNRSTYDAGGYYAMIDDMVNDNCPLELMRHRRINTSEYVEDLPWYNHCGLYRPPNDDGLRTISIRAQCESNNFKVAKWIYQNYEWMTKQNTLLRDFSDLVSNICANCMYEHYCCVKNRDVKRWEMYIEKYPNYWCDAEKIKKITGIELLDIFCDLELENDAKL